MDKHGNLDDYKKGYILPYYVKINRLTKRMVVKEKHLSSAVDCDSRKEKNSVILNKEEYNKILKIKTNKKR